VGGKQSNSLVPLQALLGKVMLVVLQTGAAVLLALVAVVARVQLALMEIHLLEVLAAQAQRLPLQGRLSPMQAVAQAAALMAAQVYLAAQVVAVTL
jgi:hypothetical protein